MPIVIEELRGSARKSLLPLLLLAEPSERALRWGMQHMSDVAYAMRLDDALIGAATMQWRDDPCELMEIGIDPARQGQGLGRQLVAWLVEEAKQRGYTSMIVGTASTSARNILFYQKCGFRPDHVRKDYFWYYPEPRYENGLQVRDEIVLRYDLMVPA